MTKAEMAKEIERLENKVKELFESGIVKSKALLHIHEQLRDPFEGCGDNIDTLTDIITGHIKKLNEKHDALDETNKVLSSDLASKYKELTMAKEGVSVLKEIIVAKEVKDYLKIRG